MAYGDKGLNPKNIILWTLLSFAIVTIINVIAGRYFPETIPIIKSGFGLPLIFVAIYVSLLFSVIFDKKIETVELWTLIVVAAVLLGSFFLVKSFVPEIFSILNNFSGGAFSILS